MDSKLAINSNESDTLLSSQTNIPETESPENVQEASSTESTPSELDSTSTASATLKKSMGVITSEDPTSLERAESDSHILQSNQGTNTPASSQNDLNQDEGPDHHELDASSVNGTEDSNKVEKLQIREHQAESVSETSFEEEDEEPPLLKYTRLNQLPSNFFKADPISTATSSEKVFIFGTHSGIVHLTNPDFSTVRTFKAHKASVLSLFTDGQYFASGSMDGTIVIGSVSDPKDITMFDYKRPIHAVVLDRNYQKTRSFICGGMAGLVIYSSKNWLDQRVDTYLDKGNGPVVAIHTLENLVLWMNDKGITIYSTIARQVVTVISKPSDSFRSDLYWPSVSFPETDRALIAWGNYIWSLRMYTQGSIGPNAGAGSSMKSRILPSAASLSFRSAPETKVEVEHVFQVDFLISGISGFSDDQWIVLAYNQPLEDEASKRLTSQCPDVKILSSMDGSTVFEEELAFNGIANLGLNDYHMLSHIGSSATTYLMLSARDGIVAQQVQLDDRLQWFLDKQLFAKAWHMSQHLVAAAERLKFGLKHMDHLVKNDDWDEASRWLSKVLYVDTSSIPIGDARSTIGTKISSTSQIEEMEALVKDVVSQWESWGEIYIRSGHTSNLTDIIPTDPRWNLNKSLFSNILTYWLECESSTDTFYTLLKVWDMDLYDMKTVINSVEHMLEKEPENKRLRVQACKLYEKSLDFSKVVPHLRILRDPNIIEFLDEHHILNLFIKDIPQILKFKFPEESDFEIEPVPVVEVKLAPVIEILVKRRHEIFPSVIVNSMKRQRMGVVNFLYLEELAKRDELMVESFANDRIDLFSQFCRPKLLPFLMTSANYDLTDAIATCENNGFVDELVYLLGEIGEYEKAMTLITKELDDPVRAINFAKMRRDPETWNVLLEYSFSRPKFIKALLEMADDQSSRFYDPMTILKNMTTEVEIEGLKDSITKVSEDQDMNVLVNQLLLRIIYKRAEEISHNFRQDLLKGSIVSIDDPEFDALSRAYETIALVPNPHAQSKPHLKLVSDLLSDDPNAKTPYTNNENKLRHFRNLRSQLEHTRP